MSGPNPDVEGFRSSPRKRSSSLHQSASNLPRRPVKLKSRRRRIISVQAHQTGGEVFHPHCFTTGPLMVGVTASPGRTTHPSFVLREATSSPVGLCTAASMGPDIGSAVRHARSRETQCDSERWGGADSEWQLHYLLHSSLGDSSSILDRPFGNVLVAVSPDPRPEGYCNVFTPMAPNYG